MLYIIFKFYQFLWNELRTNRVMQVLAIFLVVSVAFRWLSGG